MSQEWERPDLSPEEDELLDQCWDELAAELQEQESSSHESSDEASAA